MHALVTDLIKLTKPRIMLLVVVAGVTALIIEGSLLHDPLRFMVFLLGLFLTGGCANALNQYFERDIDARMTRTSGRRPLPLGKISPAQALAFSVAIGAAGVLTLGLVFNWLTAMLSVGTIVFYGFFYTLWLKPTTSQNIVIGGIAGAMAPVGAWTAATGTMVVTPWLLFAIIFFWTPPHFWSLALRFKDDYDRAKLPMLPNVRGDEAALDQILYYTIGLFVVSLLLLIVQFGWIYLATSIILGAWFIAKAHAARKYRDPERYWGLFKFSILYLFSIFLALIIDGIM